MYVEEKIILLSKVKTMNDLSYFLPNIVEIILCIHFWMFVNLRKFYNFFSLELIFDVRAWPWGKVYYIAPFHYSLNV